MRFWFSGPRFMGIRPGISFSTRDFQQKPQTRQNPAGEQIDGAFVYVVRGDHNLCKIGVTTNPQARLAQFKTASACPISFTFIAAASGDAYAVEAAAHAALERYRTNDEWFDVTPDKAVEETTAAAARLGQKLAPLSLDQANQVIALATGSEASGDVSLLGFFAWLALILAIADFVAISHFGLDSGPMIFGSVCAWIIMALIMAALRRIF